MPHMASCRLCRYEIPALEVEFVGGSLFADPQDAPLVATQKLTKRRIVVTRLVGEGALYPPPQHRETSDHVWFLIESVN